MSRRMFWTLMTFEVTQVFLTCAYLIWRDA